MKLSQGFTRDTMTSEERVKLALQHQEPDRIPLDFGATLLTGIHINAYKNLLQYPGIEYGGY